MVGAGKEEGGKGRRKEGGGSPAILQGDSPSPRSSSGTHPSLMMALGWGTVSVALSQHRWKLGAETLGAQEQGFD